MYEVILKRFENADEVRNFEKGRFELVHINGTTIGRATYEPGWKWSEHVGRAQGLNSCSVEHVGIVLAGKATAAMDDGRIIEMKAGDVFYIAPGHDSWVVGDEPYVSLHLDGSGRLRETQVAIWTRSVALTQSTNRVRKITIMNVDGVSTKVSLAKLLFLKPSQSMFTKMGQGKSYSHLVHAVVLGGSFAGLLAARVLAEHFVSLLGEPHLIPALKMDHKNKKVAHFRQSYQDPQMLDSGRVQEFDMNRLPE